MKITPLSSGANTVGAVGAPDQGSRVQALRTLRMNTNATPGYTPETTEQKLSTPADIEPADATVEATQPLSPQFAELAKRKRALQAKERELADREKALSAQLPSQGSTVDIARLKSEPLSVLLEAGVTYDQLTEAILADQNGNGSQLRAIEDRIKSIEEGVNKKLTDRDAQAEQQVLAEMRKEATQLAAQGDTYEMVRETRSIPDVMKLIERTYREKGEVLDVREAMQLVEDELVNESLKIARISKVQSRLAPPPAPATSQPQRQMRTLTNRDTASVPMTAKQRALAAFTGTLKR